METLLFIIIALLTPVSIAAMIYIKGYIDWKNNGGGEE